MLKNLIKKPIKNIVQSADYISQIYNRRFPVHENLEETLWAESETLKGKHIREGRVKWKQMIFVARWLKTNITAVREESLKLRKSITISDSSLPKVYMWWEQGFENAPDLVQYLKEKLLEKHDSINVIFLDKDNFSNYTNLPDKTWAKIDSPTKRSELLRLELLARNGGIWIDATCLCQTNLLEHFSDFFKEEREFFARYDYQKARIRTWNLASCKGGYIVTMLLAGFRLLVNDKNDFFNKKSYDCIRWLFEALFYIDKDFKNSWQNESITENVLPSYKFVRTTEDNNGNVENTAKYLCNSYIHKLTYKRPQNINPENISEALKIISSASK